MWTDGKNLSKPTVEISQRNHHKANKPKEIKKFMILYAAYWLRNNSVAFWLENQP